MYYIDQAKSECCKNAIQGVPVLFTGCKKYYVPAYMRNGGR